MRKRSREPTESASQVLGLNVSGGHERLPSYLRRMLTLRLPPLQDTLELAAPRIANRDAGESVRDVLRGLVGGFPRYLLARR
jgi:hypothetical protein